MRRTKSTCAMCDKRMSEPVGGFTLPPVCATLLDGGDGVDPDEIAGKISVDLCGKCSKVARRMIREYETSPLPQCDADAVKWSSVEQREALSGGDTSPDEFRGRGVDRQVIENAAKTVKAHRAGKAEHIFDSKVDRAYVILWSLQELGVLRGDGTPPEDVY